MDKGERERTRRDVVEEEREEEKRKGKEKEKKERDWEGVEVGDPQSGRRETCSMVCAIKQRALPTVSGSD